MHPDLPARLLAELPLDEYRVAAVLHPNIWSGHGGWQVRAWLREATEAGLVLLPPFGGWRATLVAADCLIGDHGSVTFYAAAIGTPVLLGTYGMIEVAAGTPMEDFGRRAPLLDLRRPRAQLDALRYARDPDRYGDLVARSFANPGLALRTLRDVIYRLLELSPPPRQPQTRPLGAPDPHREAVTAHLVLVAREPDVAVALERYPAVLEPPAAETSELRHLAVDDEEADTRLRESAAVHVRRARPWSAPGEERDDAATWIRATLAAYPGSRLAAAALAEGRVLSGSAAGRRLRRSWTVRRMTLWGWRLGRRRDRGRRLGRSDLVPELIVRAGPSWVRIRAAAVSRPSRRWPPSAPRAGAKRARWRVGC